MAGNVVINWFADHELRLRAENGAPRYEVIAAALEEAIAGGRFGAGERLPTVRRLARDLGVSEATVAAAYTQLNRRGWTRGEVGRGTFVAGPVPGARGEARPAIAPPDGLQRRLRAAPWRRRVLATSASRLRAAHPDALDCTSGRPDPALLPLEVLRRAWRAAIEETVAADLQYTGPEPAPALARALLPRLEADGVPAGEADLVVGSSAQQLMVLTLEIAGALVTPAERVVAVEEPGYYTIYDTLERLGCRLVGAAVDEQGVTPTSLDAALTAGATAILLTPRAHNPTGASWSPARRAALADVIAAHPGAIVIEDDQFAGVAAARPGSLLSDRRIEDRVVYIRSFSKAIGPDLRLAVAAARPRLRLPLAEAKSFADGWSSRLAQRALAHAFDDPELDAILGAACRIYAERRAVAVQALTVGLAGVDGGATGGADGVNVWVHLPHGADAIDVIERAARLGVLTAPGESFFIRPGRGDVIRLNAGAVEARQAAEAGRLLAAAATATGSAPTAMLV